MDVNLDWILSNESVSLWRRRSPDDVGRCDVGDVAAQLGQLEAAEGRPEHLAGAVPHVLQRQTAEPAVPDDHRQPGEVNGREGRPTNSRLDNTIAELI